MSSGICSGGVAAVAVGLLPHGSCRVLLLGTSVAGAGARLYLFKCTTRLLLTPGTLICTLTPRFSATCHGPRYRGSKESDLASSSGVPDLPLLRTSFEYPGRNTSTSSPSQFPNLTQPLHRVPYFATSWFRSSHLYW